MRLAVIACGCCRVGVCGRVGVCVWECARAERWGRRRRRSTTHTRTRLLVQRDAGAGQLDAQLVRRVDEPAVKALERLLDALAVLPPVAFFFGMAGRRRTCVARAATSTSHQELAAHPESLPLDVDLERRHIGAACVEISIPCCLRHGETRLSSPA